MSLVRIPAALSAMYFGSTPLKTLYAGATPLASVPAPAADIAFPEDIFDVFGVAWDPYGPGIMTTATGSTPAGLGDPVGFVPWVGNPVDYSSTTRDPDMVQATSGNRPTLVETAGRRGFAFDGVSDRLEADWVEQFEPPKAFTAFAMVYLDATANLNPLCFARAEDSNSFMEPFRVDGTAATYDPGMRHAAGAQFLQGVSYGITYDHGWKCLMLEYELNAFAPDGGAFRLEANGVEVLNATVTPSKPATASITTFTRAVIGCRRTGATFQGFFNSTVGRCGSISRLLTSAEKATLRQWLQGTSYVAF
jgi:hypothetical protein